jgi:hypothetical protein
LGIRALLTKLLTNRFAQLGLRARAHVRSARSVLALRALRLSMAWNKVASDTVALMSAEAGRHPTIGAPGPHRGSCPDEATNPCPVGRPDIQIHSTGVQLIHHPVVGSPTPPTLGRPRSTPPVSPGLGRDYRRLRAGRLD